VRALLQRVSEAEVRIGPEVTGRIGTGLLILLGVGREDDEAAARWLAAKCADLRLFDDRDGHLNLSLRETGGEALVVSQFTLYGDPRRGRRPSWAAAAEPERAVELLAVFTAALRESGVAVAEGRFGARMQVHLVNDGPVTLMVESP
jgi:D-tyrosyl-tRNA(Tyr) deacylase